MTKMLSSLIVVIGVIGSAQSLAADKGGMKKRPPKEAVLACEGKSENDSCSFKGQRSDNVSGVCFRPEASVPFACKPEKEPANGEGEAH